MWKGCIFYDTNIQLEKQTSIWLPKPVLGFKQKQRTSSYKLGIVALFNEVHLFQDCKEKVGWPESCEQWQRW